MESKKPSGCFNSGLEGVKAGNGGGRTWQRTVASPTSLDSTVTSFSQFLPILWPTKLCHLWSFCFFHNIFTLSCWCHLDYVTFVKLLTQMEAVIRSLLSTDSKSCQSGQSRSSLLLRPAIGVNIWHWLSIALTASCWLMIMIMMDVDWI